MKQKVVALLTAAVLAAGGGIVGGLDVQAAQWHQDGYGWWLQEDGGAGYAVNGWRQVDGSWYYFDGSGYMLTGWQNLGGTWYYMYDNGVMAANTWIGNYYLGASGAMVTNTWIGDYYVGGDGAWIPGYGSSQWIRNGRGWWYRHADGGYTTNGWEMIDGQWYYFNEVGYMLTGWQMINGYWYFMYDSGVMASGTWVGNYYLYDNGVMATNTWIGGYYVGADGCWVSDDSALKEQEVWALVNEARAANGLEALQYDYTLAEAAGKRAEELVSNLSHNRPDGSVCFTVLEEYGIRYWSAGENIAAGFTDAATVMNGWLNSPGHYMNIMGDYSHIGVGHYTDAYGTEYWVQLFITK